MTDTVKVILDLSDDVQEFLDQQQVDVYREIQQELPSIKLEVMSDPDAPTGSKDLIIVIVATAALISTLTPIVIRILNQFKPDSTDLVLDEKETHHPDGSVTIHRTRVYSKREYNRQAQQIQPSQTPDLPQLESGKDAENASN